MQGESLPELLAPFLLIFFFVFFVMFKNQLESTVILPKIQGKETCARVDYRAWKAVQFWRSLP